MCILHTLSYQKIGTIVRIAVNYSPQAASLLQEGCIEFDLFKCPDWPKVIEAARQYRPTYVHFPLKTRLNSLELVDWAKIEDLLSKTDTQYINLHIAPHASDFPGMPQDTSDSFWRERVEESVIVALQWVIRTFGQENLILENVPWDLDPDYAIPRPVIEPDFVKRLIDETGCGFLLDTAHARISSVYLGIDPIAYLNEMPTDHLREVHITGTTYSEEYVCLIDHCGMTEDDWDLAAYTMNQICSGSWAQPGIVALEYGGVGPLFEWRSEPEILATDVPKLYELVQAAQSQVQSVNER